MGAESSETRGVTRAQYTGPVTVKFTNASPDRMCGFYMVDDTEESYGDNWLPEAGVPSGKSIDFRIKPGKYKARWDTCRSGSKPFYAATLWRETAVSVQHETQLYAFIADNVPPTKRAPTMGRDYAVVRFPGQMIDPSARPGEPREQQVALRASDEVPQIAGFIGLVMLNTEQVARLFPETDDKLDAHDLVDPNAKLPAARPGEKQPPEKPSLSRKRDLSNGGGIEYRKR